MSSLGSRKPLGAPRGSFNTPIAAFTMVVLIGAWSMTTIRSYRRISAQEKAGTDPDTAVGPPPRSYSEPMPKIEQPEWMRQALKESREQR